MAVSKNKASDFIMPLYMNGMSGRMLRMPAPEGKKREILFIYGHHSSLERWWGVVQDLNQYGTVTMPDLPGFGGMDSLYKIGQKPNLDTMADYLAAFIKMQYNKRKVTIVGMSYGFVVVTRMLQRCPDLTGRVDMLVSAAGFVNHNDLKFTKSRKFAYRALATFFSLRPTALFYKNVLLHPSVIRTVYRHTHNAKNKFKGLSEYKLKAMLDVEVDLWRSNDVRTYMATTNTILTVDLCGTTIDLPVWHIGVQEDQYFNNNLVEQHMRVVYKDYKMSVSSLDKHAPSVISTVKDAQPLIPDEVRQVLAAF